MWLVLNSLVKTIGGGFIALQLIQSAFVNGIVFYVIQKKCSYKYFCVVLYFLLYYQYFTTEIMREAMAISIFLLSFDFLLSGKYLKYYVLAILAVLFHVSAVVLLIVPFFKIFERKNYNIVVLSTLVLISATLIWVIFLFLVGRISIYIEYLEQISDTYLDRENNVFGIISSFLFYALPYIVVLSYIDTSKIDNTYENRFILISIIIVKALAISCSPLSRFSNYFVIFALIVIVNLMGHIKVSHKKMAVTLCVIVLIYNQFSFYFKDYSMYTGGKKSHYYNLFIPYSSYLDPQEDNLREEIVWGQEHLKYIK